MNKKTKCCVEICNSKVFMNVKINTFTRTFVLCEFFNSKYILSV